VDSAVVVLEPLPESDRFDDLAALEKLTAAAFGQRRKMLRAALKSLPGAAEALEGSGIDPTRRAETLSQAEFRHLTALWRRDLDQLDGRKRIIQRGVHPVAQRLPDVRLGDVRGDRLDLPDKKPLGQRDEVAAIAEPIPAALGAATILQGVTPKTR